LHYFIADDDEFSENESLRDLLKEVRRWLKKNPDVAPVNLSLSREDLSWSAILLYGGRAFDA
jgi:hypothetical protein